MRSPPPSPPPAKISEKVFPTLINLICNNSDAAAQAPRHKSQRQRERETPHSVRRCVSVCMLVCVFIAVPFMRGHSGPFRGVAAWIVYANMQCETQKPSTPNMSVNLSVSQPVSWEVSQALSQLVGSVTERQRAEGVHIHTSNCPRRSVRFLWGHSNARGKRATATATARGSDLIVMQSTHKFSIWLALCALKCSHFTPRVAECRATTICNDLLKWHLHILSHLFANQSGAWAAFSAIRQTRFGQLANIYDPTTAITIAITTTTTAVSSSQRICCCYWLCITLNASDNGNVKDALNLLANTHTAYTHTDAHSSLWPLSEIITTKSEWVLCCTYRHNPSIY